MAWISQSEYARRRNVSPARISQLRNAGRLKGAVRTRGRSILIDPDKADQLLTAAHDPAWDEQSKLNGRGDSGNGGGDGEESPGAPEQSEFAKAKEMHELAKAALRRLEYEEKAGKLVRADEVETAAFNRARAVRDAMLNIPDRIAAVLAAERDPGRIRNILTQEIKQALEELSR